MDRKTRRMRRDRVRARRVKLVLGAVLATGAVIGLAATAVGQVQQQGADHPTPRVDKVDLTAQQPPANAGWEGQVGTDANLVAVEWNGDQSAEYTFEVRDQDGEWQKAADSGTFDNGPDPGTRDAEAGGATPATKNVTEPVWVGRDVTGVRVRLDSGTAQDVTLHVIDSTTGEKPDTHVESTSPTPTEPPAPAPPPSAPPPSAGGTESAPPSSTTTTTTTTTAIQQGVGPGLAFAALATLVAAFIVRRRRTLAVIVAAVLLLAACTPVKGGAPGSMPGRIVARSQWAPDLPWNWDACPGGPEYAYVANAIVHHTVNSNNYGPGDAVGIMRGIWAYHVQSLGYCDIAYNFLIDNYGVPYEGRLGGIDQPVIGAHSLNWNTGTTGIAIVGTFSSVIPSYATRGTLEDLIRWKFKVHGVNPFEVDHAHILGHRDTYATECPGQALYNYLPTTRHWVKAYW